MRVEIDHVAGNRAENNWPDAGHTNPSEGYGLTAGFPGIEADNTAAIGTHDRGETDACIELGLRVDGATENEPRSLLGFLGDPPDPQPIRDRLLPVEQVLPEYIPEPLRPWLADIAERMQCPLEFPAVGALVAVASLVGRRIAIRPKRYDNWDVVPNLWGGVVGRPGVMKSPALSAVLKPLWRLESQARELFKSEMDAFQQDVALAKSRSEAAQRELKDELRNAATDEVILRDHAARAAAVSLLEPPTQKRYLLNDPTVEMLGEILKVNANGVLVYRDELTGFLRSLEKPGRETDRAFYLEAWNGNSPFTFDRIGRGSTFIPAVCASILGGIQPGPLGDYFEAAARNGSHHDGLISRFQLLVYPDDGEWVNIDRWPDQEAGKRAAAVFERLAELSPMTIGAVIGEFDDVPYLRFDPGAQDLFDQWRHELENLKIRAADEDPLIVCHLSKYRSLMPKLALLFHLIEVVDGASTGPVSLRSAELAAAWCDILESHARRIYDGFGDPTAVAARALAARIKAGDVPDKFACHWVANRGWSGLDTSSVVASAVERLESLGWVHREAIPTTSKGGRPAIVVHINLKLRGSGR